MYRSPEVAGCMLNKIIKFREEAYEKKRETFHEFYSAIKVAIKIESRHVHAYIRRVYKIREMSIPRRRSESVRDQGQFLTGQTACTGGFFWNRSKRETLRSETPRLNVKRIRGRKSRFDPPSHLAVLNSNHANETATRDVNGTWKGDMKSQSDEIDIVISIMRKAVLSINTCQIGT